MMQDASVMLTPGAGSVRPGYEQSAPTTNVQDAFQQPDQAQFEADKRAVYKHPLFPLLALLFERCEQATQSAECPNSDSFNMDIQAFVQHQERDRKPFLMNDPEVDGLMIKAIQVLRIHLLELEKVQELCKDFCNRYITCLKGKMQSENLLRSDYASGYEHNNNNSCHSSESSSPPGQQSSYPTSPHAGHMTPASPHPVQVVSSTGGGIGSSNGSSGPQQQQQHHHFAGVGPGSGDLLGPGVVGGASGAFALALSPSPSPSLGALSLPTSAHVPVSTTPPAPESPGIIHGSTPLSQIGANPYPQPSDSGLMHGTLSPSPTSPGSADDDDDFLGRGKKQKRGVLPKHATSIMRSWLFQHLVHPYPTEDEKRTIAAQTNLTLLQVNNWFINARRRILQPMLDASSTSEPTGSGNNNHTGSKSGGSKKAKLGCRDSAPTHRVWPDNMAGLQAHLLAQEHNGANHEESSLLSSGAEDSDVDGENDGGWSQDEDGDDGTDLNEDAAALNSGHQRLKAEPSSDSEQ